MFVTISTKSRGLLAVIAAFTLSACGLQQSVSDGTASAFEAVFYKQIKTLHLDFTARESLNSDSREHNPLSQPVMVRVFQLRERKAFDRAVYQQLTGDAADVLKAELLADRDVVLTPGGDVSLNMPMEKEARYVAVVALFQQPDMAKNSWRQVLERNDLDPDKPRVIELSSHSLRLIVEDKK